MTIPYCPNKKCTYHNLKEKLKNWYIHKGFYTTLVSGTLPRFKCKSCGRTFSERTFSIDYFTKRQISYKAIYTHLKTASGIRDMARDLICTTDTISNRIFRLSRQMWAAESLFGEDPLLNENLSADGLESFVESRYYPSYINILAGSKSQFLYSYSSYFFKRKGTMTEDQKIERDNLYKTARFEKKGASRSFNEILNHAYRLSRKTKKKYLYFDTDENPVYQYCLRNHVKLRDSIHRGEIIHRQTNSQLERNRGNKLFSCNYIDRQIRKDLAEHVRETVQFSRDINCSMERFAIYRFWHNYEKPWRINAKYRKFRTHAEAAGIGKECIKQLRDSVFKGFRIPMTLIDDRLTTFQRKSWLRNNLNPKGETLQYFPKFVL